MDDNQRLVYWNMVDDPRLMSFEDALKMIDELRDNLIRNSAQYIVATNAITRRPAAFGFEWDDTRMPMTMRQAIEDRRTK